MSATLHELAVKHGTDKARHGYCEFYEQVFGPYRERIARVLEIGVKDGASLRVWLDYFPNAHIFGLDNGTTGDPDRWPRGPRVTIIAGDQGTVPDLFRAGMIAGLCEIILDDGGHTMWQQQLSFAALWPHLWPGGWYVIEDTHTSRILDGFGRNDSPETTEAMLGRLQFELGFEIESMAGGERDATSVIRKPGRRTP